MHLSGFTMGTSYRVTLLSKPDHASLIHQQIEQKLKQINQLMSTYIDNSELSRFNRSNAITCQKISKDTYFVVKQAIEISKQTNGMFDVTIDPLISEWGFDRKQTNDQVPTQAKINQLLNQIGYDKLALGESCIQKQTPNISVNLSAIAKGYAVDQIAELLINNEVKNYLVEIGGETASKGKNPKSEPWRLAIESPSLKQRQIQQIFNPLGFGVATSGDYRNYFEKHGIRFSHTIDPSTGKPITHKLASVTVLHKQTMLADAYATSFMVMGTKKALEFAEKNKLAVFMIVKTKQGFDTIYSSQFEWHLVSNTTNQMKLYN